MTRLGFQINLRTAIPRANRIRLNICPTSNLMLSRVESLASHPIRMLFDAGVRVTGKTDGMIMFGQSVSHEFRPWLGRIVVVVPVQVALLRGQLRFTQAILAVSTLGPPEARQA